MERIQMWVASEVDLIDLKRKETEMNLTQKLDLLLQVAGVVIIVAAIMFISLTPTF